MDTDCPTRFEWKHPCQRFGIAIKPTRINMSWSRHTPPNEALIPDLLYQLRHVPAHDLSMLFDLMANQRNKSPNPELTQHISHLILLAVAQLLSQPQLSSPNPWDHYHLICEYINQNLDQPLDRKTISNFFHLHPDYISHLFANVGTGFVVYLHARRMQHAVELLTSTPFHISQIASMCGYSSSGYFIKIFRSQYQISPRQYRLQHQA
jgi:AraC-like DNA-binding protein